MLQNKNLKRRVIFVKGNITYVICSKKRSRDMHNKKKSLVNNFFENLLTNYHKLNKEKKKTRILKGFMNFMGRELIHNMSSTAFVPSCGCAAIGISQIFPLPSAHETAQTPPARINLRETNSSRVNPHGH